jgi:hypothetical protein
MRVLHAAGARHGFARPGYLRLQEPAGFTGGGAGGLAAAGSPLTCAFWRGPIV